MRRLSRAHADDRQLSLWQHPDLDVAGPATLRHDHHLLVELHLELRVDVHRRVEEARDVTIVQRLRAEDLRTRFQPGDHERAIVAQREPANELSRRGIERDDVSAEYTFAVLRDLATDAACLALERLIAIDVREAGNIVGSEPPIADVARREGDRKHHRLSAEDTPAARAQLGLAQSGMRQPEEMSDLVECDGLDVEAPRDAGLRCGPCERGIEEDIGFDDLTRGRI